MNESKNVKALKKQLAAAIAMVCVAAVALGSSTYAWFVSNTRVQANMSSVSATSATPNLLIVNGATSTGTTWTAKKEGGLTTSSIASTTATALYPASTNDIKTWWAVNSWTTDSGATVANGYYNPTIQEVNANTAGDIKAGQYSQGANTLNAYQVATYSVYTTTGSVELNLDPESPITVAVDQQKETATGTGFKDALRVGIAVDGQLKVVYAPTDNEKDSAKGNDKDAVTGWRTVKDASNTEKASYITLAGNTFTGWTATKGTDGSYTKATNKLADVDSNGKVVQVYVWLEGTDSDCIVGKADAASDDDTYKVTLNFVGATVTANSEP